MGLLSAMTSTPLDQAFQQQINAMTLQHLSPTMIASINAFNTEIEAITPQLNMSVVNAARAMQVNSLDPRLMQCANSLNMLRLLNDYSASAIVANPDIYSLYERGMIAGYGLEMSKDQAAAINGYTESGIGGLRGRKYILTDYVNTVKDPKVALYREMSIDAKNNYVKNLQQTISYVFNGIDSTDIHGTEESIDGFEDYIE